MKAITLWQPWAWAIAFAGKRIEPASTGTSPVTTYAQAALTLDEPAPGRDHRTMAKTETVKIAALVESAKFLGIECGAEYFEVAKERILAGATREIEDDGGNGK